VRRREFIAGLGGTVAWPLVARAQQADRVRRIGVLIFGDENDPIRKAQLSGFTQGLAESGWTDGRNPAQVDCTDHASREPSVMISNLAVGGGHEGIP
jgi:hypothetical protein